MVIPHVRDPYWIAVAYGAYLAAKDMGVRLDLRPAGGYLKLGQMISDIEDLIARGVDGMVISAVDYSAVAVPVKKAWDAGIPTTSALIPTAYKEAPGATINDYETGEIQAKLAAEDCPRMPRSLCSTDLLALSGASSARKVSRRPSRRSPRG